MTSRRLMEKASTPLPRRTVAKKPRQDVFEGRVATFVTLALSWLFFVLLEYAVGMRIEYFLSYFYTAPTILDLKYRSTLTAVGLVTLAFGIDVAVFFLVPGEWLIFVASVYVWGYIVWDLVGFCLPAVAVWTIFVYFEIFFRPLSSSLFCRSLAAHSVGFPILLFFRGLKNYVAFWFAQRQKMQVRAQNKYCKDLIAQAVTLAPGKPEIKLEIECTSTSNGSGTIMGSQPSTSLSIQPSTKQRRRESGEKRDSPTSVHSQTTNNSPSLCSSQNVALVKQSSNSSYDSFTSALKEEDAVTEIQPSLGSGIVAPSVVVRRDVGIQADLPATASPSTDSKGKGDIHIASLMHGLINGENVNERDFPSMDLNNGVSSQTLINMLQQLKAEVSQRKQSQIQVAKLEKDITKHKATEMNLKNELSTVRQNLLSLEIDFENVKAKNAEMNSIKHKLEKSKQANEKVLAQEQEQRAKAEAESKSKDSLIKDLRKQTEGLQTQLNQKSEELGNASKIVAEKDTNIQRLNASVHSLKNNVRDLREEVKRARKDGERLKGQIDELAYVNEQLRKDQGSIKDVMEALKSLQEKNQALQATLAAETRFKMDLMGELGRARREIESYKRAQMGLS
eukprot:Colp12_sorted_trinity150504_noHs@22399